MSKLSNQNKIIVGVLSLFLILIVGYAIFSESINVGGTASASGEFNIIFNSVGTIKEVGSSGATAEISGDKKMLTVSVPNLEYPSAYVEIDVTIINSGSITAVLEGIETVGLDNPDIKVTYSGVEQGEIIGSSQEKRMKVKVTWDKESTNFTASSTFRITLTYVQDTNNKTTTTTKLENTYLVGDEICLGSECFYIIKDNGNSVTALAKYNLLVGNVSSATSDYYPIESSVEGYGLQSASAIGDTGDAKKDIIGVLMFSDSNYWIDSGNKLLGKYGNGYPVDIYDSNSLLYQHVKNYENYLKTTLGKASVSARLITHNELENLGCSVNDESCNSAPSWVYATSYWTASAFDHESVLFVISGPISNNYSYDYYNDDIFFGIRPVISILKTEL